VLKPKGDTLDCDDDGQINGKFAKNYYGEEMSKSQHGNFKNHPYNSNGFQSEKKIPTAFDETKIT